MTARTSEHEIVAAVAVAGGWLITCSCGWRGTVRDLADRWRRVATRLSAQ
jgi:hypothetical protein